MLKMRDIEEMSSSQVEAKIQELRKSYFELSLKGAMAPLEKPHLLKNYKKDIARLSTMLKRKG